MKTPGIFRVRALLWCGTLALVAIPPTRAQTTPDADAPASKDVTVLPSFSVASQQDKSFTGHESMSLTRTGVDVSDIPQSITVVNRTYIDAINPGSLADMVAYVGGGQIGNINWGIDRYMIRGFTSMGDFVDGFLTGAGGNAPTTSMNFVDHMEIVKGPAAIMSTNASGVVGGAVNKVSKSPMQNQTDTLTVEYGRYDDTRAVLDVGGALTPDKRLLYRVLLLGQDQKGYYDYTYDKRTDLMPMVQYDFSPTTQAWIKGDLMNFHYSSYNGLPLDGRTNQVVAVSPTTNYGEDTPGNWRELDMWRVWGQFTTRPSDHLAIRFAAIDSSVTYHRTESVLSPSGTTTPTLQPNGTYAYAPYVQYTIPPNYVAGQLINRSTTADTGTFKRREVQNDYVFTFDTGPAHHNLVVGGDLVDFPQTTKAWSSGGSSFASSSPINPFALMHPGVVSVPYNLQPTSFQDTNQTYAKIFALETANLFSDRLILTYGVSRHRFDLSSTTYPYNEVTGVAGATTYVPDTELYKNIVQYGIVFKPVKGVSVFYGNNSNFAANGIQNGTFLPPQQGKQKEAGVKAVVIPKRFSLSASYFEIFQVNNTLPAFPQTSPPTQVLIPGETSRGFDGDFTATITKNIDLVGSFALFKAHVQEGAPYNLAPAPYDGKLHTTIPVSDISERNFAIWVRYTFTQASLRGLSLGIGENTISKRAITDSSNQIMYGYIPGYNLFNANAVYETKHYKVQFNLDNMFNQKYLYSARSNQVIVPGIPINPRVAVTYKY